MVPGAAVVRSPPPPPRRRRGRFWAVCAGVVVLSIAVVMGAAYGLVRTFDGLLESMSCTADAQATDAALADVDQLRLHPPAARAKGGPQWDCDSDGDGPASVWVAQSFESAGGPSEVLRYYRQALPDAGWSGVDEGVPDEPGFEGVGGITCFAGTVTGRPAYLRLSFALEDGRDTTMYDLVIRRADPDGTGCSW